MLRRNSVQALFNGYYYDKSIAAIQTPKQVENTAIIRPENKDTTKMTDKSQLVES